MAFLPRSAISTEPLIVIVGSWTMYSTKALFFHSPEETPSTVMVWSAEQQRYIFSLLPAGASVVRVMLSVLCWACSLLVQKMLVQSRSTSTGKIFFSGIMYVYD